LALLKEIIPNPVRGWTGSLNSGRLGTLRSLLRPFSGGIALLVSGALARSDLVERPPLRFHPNVGIAREHCARNVPGDPYITSSPAPDSASSVTGVWRRSELPQSGAGDQTIMGNAGHVSHQMFARYSHIRMEAKRKALEGIASQPAPSLSPPKITRPATLHPNGSSSLYTGSPHPASGCYRERLHPTSPRPVILRLQ
jgi:hypothetical protein